MPRGHGFPGALNTEWQPEKLDGNLINVSRHCRHTWDGPIHGKSNSSPHTKDTEGTGSMQGGGRSLGSQGVTMAARNHIHWQCYLTLAVSCPLSGCSQQGPGSTGTHLRLPKHLPGVSRSHRPWLPELVRKLSCIWIFKLPSQAAAKAACLQQSPSAQSQEPQI